MTKQQAATEYRTIRAQSKMDPKAFDRKCLMLLSNDGEDLALDNPPTYGPDLWVSAAAVVLRNPRI